MDQSADREFLPGAKALQRGGNIAPMPLPSRRNSGFLGFVMSVDVARPGPRSLRPALGERAGRQRFPACGRGGGAGVANSSMIAVAPGIVPVAMAGGILPKGGIRPKGTAICLTVAEGRVELPSMRSRQSFRNRAIAAVMPTCRLIMIYSLRNSTLYGTQLALHSTHSSLNSLFDPALHQHGTLRISITFHLGASSKLASSQPISQSAHGRHVVGIPSIAF